MRNAGRDRELPYRTHKRNLSDPIAFRTTLEIETGIA
jgi:hypothetical protein